MILIAFVERTFHKISRSNFEVYAEKSNRPIGSIDLENLLVSYWFSRGNDRFNWSKSRDQLQELNRFKVGYQYYNYKLTER